MLYSLLCLYFAATN